MPRFLLDTNICIYIARHRPPEVLARFEKLAPGDAVISVITYGELAYGAEKSARKTEALANLERLIGVITVIDPTQDTAREYGRIRAVLETEGRPIGNNDLWIAAHAKSARLTLVTNNTREFERVRGLKVRNWVRAG